MVLGLGVEGVRRVASVVERGVLMRVSVYKLEDGKMDVLVESTPGKGRSPVMLPDVTREDVVERVLPLVTQMRRPKGAQLEIPF